MTRYPDPQRLWIAGDADAGLGGADLMHTVEWWADHVFDIGQTPHLRAMEKWRRLLRSCRNTPDRWAQLGLPPAASIERFVWAHDLSEYHRIQDELDTQPLSDWDLHIYTERLHDDLLYLDDLYQIKDGPRLYIQPTVRAFRVYQFWAVALHELDAAGRDRLWHNAKTIAREEEVLRDPDALPPPSIMEWHG